MDNLIRWSMTAQPSPTPQPSPCLLATRSSLIKQPTTSAQDTDADGLRDAWELRFAANLTVLGLTGKPTSGKDSDGDGRSDAAEQVEGTNPIDIEIETRPRNSRQWMQAELSRFSVAASPGFSYRLQTSTNLTQWQLIGSSFETTGTQLDISLPVTLWTGPGPRRFFRLISQ